MSGSLGRVWLAAASLCGGTYLGAHEAVTGLWLLAVITGACLIPLRRHPMAGLGGIVLLCVGAGSLNAHARLDQPGPLDELARSVPLCDVSGTTVESTGALGTLVSITAASCPDWSGTSLGVVSIPDEVGDAGARFTATGWLIPLRDDGFDTARRRSGALASLHVKAFDIVAPPSGPHALAARVRAGLHTAVSHLDPRSAALLEGLTIGDTSGLDPATLDVFRSAGLSHVLAVSGSNVAIVLGAVAMSLRSLALRLRILCAYLALGMFVLIVGPDASVLRAGAMGAIALACLVRGRSAEPLAALGLAVIAVIALKPGMLFSAGMQLSAAATAGIVIFCEPIARRLARLPGMLRMMLAATLAAQVAVVPILVLVFGELSVIAPLANALALPAVGPATVAGLAAGVIAIILPGAGQLVARAVAPAAWWVVTVADYLGGLDWSLVRLPAWTGWPALVAVVVAAIRVIRREDHSPPG